jgi:glycosyltransferase involved in cell wall biosynthesis
VPALLNAADTFVLSSDIEGLPMVLVEALASGCPVVATDAPGVREVVQDQGTIVPRDDATALAVALDAALRHGEVRPRRSRTPGRNDRQVLDRRRGAALAGDLRRPRRHAPCPHVEAA